MASIVGFYVRPESVTFCDPPGVIVGKPGFACRILPHQRFQRQIDTDLLVGLHERRTRLGAAKDQEFGRPNGRSTCAAPTA